MTPESRKRWRFILIVGFVVVLVLGMAAYPSYIFIKKWRANSLMEDSQSKKKVGDLIGAVEAAQAAYQLEPNDVLIVRNIAEIYAKLDPMRAIIFWSKLVKLSGNPEDRIQLAQIALQAGNLD
ncbi:MAG TPA: hypothetical protein PLV25_01230, partial [Opitutales bacterium]|nr:hypothetical protein [Opitutales bacterium]